MRFTVIDLLTGKEPDLEQIALNDECGKYAYCPHDRFKIEVEFLKLKESYVFVY